MPFSQSFFEELAVAAGKLSEETTLVRLPDPFSGFLVTLEKPDIDEKRIEMFTFEQIGLQREGVFYVVLENLWGKLFSDFE